MVEFIAQNMAPIMFGSLIVFLLLGYPIGFTLSALGLIFFFIAVELAPFSGGTINLSWALLQASPERIFGIMNNDTLLAIPFFTFMGIILERSGMAEDLLDTIGQLFGPLRGGIAYAVVFVGALLAATTGVVAASVISMGLISLPIMMRYGYDARVATGAITASGTLAQIIPPSLVLIVLADQLGRSVGDMYIGALYPALLLTACYALLILILSLVRPASVPALPPEARTLGSGVLSLVVLLALAMAGAYVLDVYFLVGRVDPQNEPVFAAIIAFGLAYLTAVANRTFKLGLLSRLSESTILVLMPPLGLIFLVLGTIFLGIATPTEGGAMGAMGAIIIAFAKGRLNFALLRQAVETTGKLSAFVLFILVGARVFSLTYYGVDGHIWIKNLLTALPGGMYGFILITNFIIFLLGFFLDFFEIAFILIPLLKLPAETIFHTAPEAIAIAKSLDLEVVTRAGQQVVSDVGPFMVWFGVLVAMNMQTSFLTPPVGFALFYLRSVAPAQPYTDKVTGKTMPAITTGQIYQGAVAFVVIQVLMVIVMVTTPALVMHYAKGDASRRLNQEQVDDKLRNLQIPGFSGPDSGPGLDLPLIGLPGPPPGLGGPPSLPGLSPPPALPGLSPPPALPDLAPPAPPPPPSPAPAN